MEDPTYRAAVVGESHSREMAPICAATRRILARWEIREFPGLTELQDASQAGGFFPDVVLVCQHWRDEYSADQVRLGLGTFPVARWICVYGAWCESEGRHGSRWPLAVRVPMRSLENRLAIEAAVVRGLKPALPLTAARDEAFEFDADRQFAPCPDREFSVVVQSPDKELRAWLLELCRKAGYHAAITGEEGGAARLLILDLDPCTTSVRNALEKLTRTQPQTAVLGLMGLVHPEDVLEFQSQGVAAVLSKLSPAAQLLEAIRELCQGTGQGE